MNDFFKKASQTLGQLKKGYAIDTPFTKGFPVSEIISAPAAADEDGVLAATTLAVAAATISGGITDPVTARAVQIKGSAATISGNVTVYGKDTFGMNRSEVIATNGASAVEGVIPFSAVDRVALPAYVVSGETISVGITDKLGLARPLKTLKQLEADDVTESAAANSTVYHTITPTTSPNGSVVFTVYYETEMF